MPCIAALPNLALRLAYRVMLRSDNHCRHSSFLYIVSPPPIPVFVLAICAKRVSVLKERRRCSIHNQGMEEIDLTAGSFCKATAVEVVKASLGSVLAHADLTKEQRYKMMPDEILGQMKAGNERFRRANRSKAIS